MEQTSLKIVRILQDAGHQAYWAGGCVRDMLLGKEPKDYDIATSATPDQIEDLLEKTIPKILKCPPDFNTRKTS